jgi:hypothetical protein
MRSTFNYAHHHVHERALRVSAFSTSPHLSPIGEGQRLDRRISR